VGVSLTQSNWFCQSQDIPKDHKKNIKKKLRKNDEIDTKDLPTQLLFSLNLKLNYMRVVLTWPSWHGRPVRKLGVKLTKKMMKLTKKKHLNPTPSLDRV
jgi:hypothetical protein